MKEPSRAEAADDPTRNTGDVVSWENNAGEIEVLDLNQPD
jgi:hypothetical protein